MGKRLLSSLSCIIVKSEIHTVVMRSNQLSCLATNADIHEILKAFLLIHDIVKKVYCSLSILEGSLPERIDLEGINNETEKVRGKTASTEETEPTHTHRSGSLTAEKVEYFCTKAFNTLHVLPHKSPLLFVNVNTQRRISITLLSYVGCSWGGQISVVNYLHSS